MFIIMIMLIVIHVSIIVIMSNIMNSIMTISYVITAMSLC